MADTVNVNDRDKAAYYDTINTHWWDLTSPLFPSNATDIAPLKPSSHNRDRCEEKAKAEMVKILYVAIQIEGESVGDTLTKYGPFDCIPAKFTC